MMSAFARVVIAIRIPMVARTGPRPPGHRWRDRAGMTRSVAAQSHRAARASRMTLSPRALSPSPKAVVRRYSNSPLIIQ
jgi:hypothetical protein